MKNIDVFLIGYMFLFNLQHTKSQFCRNCHSLYPCNPDVDGILVKKYMMISMKFDTGICVVWHFTLQVVCLIRHDFTQSWHTSGPWSSKMNWGVSTLLILAAFLTMASASATFPWESSHRGDSGITLGHYSREKQAFSMAEMNIN